MRLTFTAEERQAYIKGKWNHLYYEDCVKLAKSMQVHFDGSYPECLIDERRPNEPEEVKAYRKKIWVPKTKPTCTRVYNSLQKIRRSSDWSIRYPSEPFNKIPDEETLEVYMEKRFPYFQSFTNWTFQVMLRQYLIDANGLVLFMPIQLVDGLELMESEFNKPFPYIFNACDILDYVPESYAVLKNPQGCKYLVNSTWKDGKSFYFVTTENIWRYDQVDDKGTYTVMLEIQHNLGMLPAVKWRGVMVCHHGHYMKYESRLAGMIPEMDEAVREYSDLQAAKVLHIYPERWEFAQNECRTCKGTGQRRNPEWVEGSTGSCDIQCNSCEGRGYVVAGPYSKIIVRPQQGLEVGGTAIPMPPAGYVEKDTEIVKVQEESIEKHLYNALAAVNFEFLAQSPIAQSGVAKAEDRDEASNTANSIAEDIVAFMDESYKICAAYRYNIQYGMEEIEKMLPIIAVPEKFDLVTAKEINEQLKAAKDAKANPQVINAIEVEYAHRKFAQEPEIRDMVSLTIQLDPLAGISEEDKMSRLSNKGITQLTYITSSNIQEFVQTALDDDSKFIEKELPEQREIIKAMAQGILDEQNAEREKLMNGVQPDTEEDNESGDGVPADDTAVAEPGATGNTA